MLTRFRWRLTRLTQDFITELMVGVSAREGRRRQNMLERRVAFKLDRHRVALQGLIRLAGGAGSLSEMLYYEASRFANRELDRARRLVTQLGDQAPAEKTSEPPPETRPLEGESGHHDPPPPLSRSGQPGISGLTGLSPGRAHSLV